MARPSRRPPQRSSARGRCVAIAAAVLVAWLPALAGCSTVPAGKRMAALGVETAGARHDASVAVHVEGGGGLSFRISDAAFEQAVTQSLLDAGVFSALVSLDAADYRLDAILGDCRQPFAGAQMTAEMNVLWNLSRVDTRETVWQALIPSAGTATMGAAFNADVRLRKATERAARENIAEAIRQLAAVDLEGEGPPEPPPAAAGE